MIKKITKSKRTISQRPNPLLIDPTGTRLEQQVLEREIVRRFRNLKREITKFIAQEDAFGLRDPLYGSIIKNAFCPTGKGGGIDPTCSPGEGSAWNPSSDKVVSHDSWKSIEADPKYLYHALSVDNVVDIQSGGLDPHKPSYGTDQWEWPDRSRALRSYFTKSPSTAWQFAPDNGKPALLRVRNNKRFKTENTGDVYLERTRIAPSALEVLTENGWKRLKNRPVTNELMIINAFCSTGEGGGIDNTCPPSNKGGASKVVSDWAAKRFSNPAHAKAFVKWFGDSKVVDEKDEPLVVYHGTDAEFDEFNTERSVESGKTSDPNAFLGAHFTASQYTASEFAETLYHDEDASGEQKVGGSVKPVFLSIKKPLMMGEGRPPAVEMKAAENRYAQAQATMHSHSVTRMNSDEYKAKLDAAILSGDDGAIDKALADPKGDELYKAQQAAAYAISDLKDKHRPMKESEIYGAADLDYDHVSRKMQQLKGKARVKYAAKVGRKMRKSLEEKGYDGVLYENAYEEETGIGAGDEKRRTYIAFHSTQIKSATGNRGTFDPSDPLTTNRLIVNKAASTQVNILDAHIVTRIMDIQNQIDLQDVIKLEDNPHITIRYGLEDIDPERVAGIIKQHPSIEVELGGLSLFESDEQDVLKIDVKSKALKSINSHLGILPNIQTHDRYVPHLTVAYLKSGTGIKYAGKSGLEKTRLTFQSMVYSDVDRNYTSIYLNSKPHYVELTFNASSCGAGSGGSPGFQPGNTCGGGGELDTRFKPVTREDYDDMAAGSGHGRAVQRHMENSVQLNRYLRQGAILPSGFSTKTAIDKHGNIVSGFSQMDESEVVHHDKQVVEMDKAFSGKAAPRDITLYRALHFEKSPDNDFTDEGFPSLSISHDQASAFGDNIIKVRVKRGTPLITSGSFVETEFILPRDTEFEKLQDGSFGVKTKKSMLVRNDFCPTGSGGGIDPTCSPGGIKRPPIGKPTLEEFQEWSDKGWFWGESGWEPPVSREQVSADISNDEHTAAARTLSNETVHRIAASHSWEESKPWNASEDDVKSGNILGFTTGGQHSNTEIAHYEGEGIISLSPEFFKLKDEGSRRHVVYHELGHQLADTMSADLTGFRLVDAGVITTDHWMGSANTPEEFLADAYATLHTDLKWLKEKHPKSIKPIVDRARALGMPLPKGITFNESKNSQKLLGTSEPQNSRRQQHIFNTRQRRSYAQPASATDRQETVTMGQVLRVVGPFTELVTNAPFSFLSSEEKLNGFAAWLKERVSITVLAKSFLQSVAQQQDHWLTSYIRKTFLGGMGKMFDYLKRPELQESLDFYKGTKAQFLESAFLRPPAVERVKLLASRAFNELQGVTDQMAVQMQRTLVDGFIRGDSPFVIARDLNRNVDDIGIKRARTIARTEVIRAHNLGRIETMEAHGMTEVGVAVEWSTSGLGTTKRGNPSPCKLCAPLAGIVLKLEEARTMFPRHPNCCTDPNTLITMGDGFKKIVDVKVGDYVLTHIGEYRKVLQLHRSSAKNRMVVELLITARGSSWTLELTDDHPVYSEVEGYPDTDMIWKAAGEQRPRDKIQCFYVVGSSPHGFFGEIAEVKFKVFPECTLYNLSVDVQESYVANGVAVHNCSCTLLPSGVGESTKGQLRTEKKIQSAVDKSLKAERGKSKRSIEQQRKRSRWQGATTRIDKKRPKPII